MKIDLKSHDKYYQNDIETRKLEYLPSLPGITFTH